MKFVERFRVAGDGWTADEMTQTTDWRKAAQEMAADMKAAAPGWMLTFLGQTSSGKTMLGKCLLRFSLKLAALRPALYTAEPPHGPAEIYWPDHDWQEVRALKTATFLLVDEVGRGREPQRLMDLVNYRLERRLYTVLTSNQTYRELKASDAALASRLRRNGGRVLASGADIRPFEDRK